jgi:hypothetical protein
MLAPPTHNDDDSFGYCCCKQLASSLPIDVISMCARLQQARDRYTVIAFLQVDTPFECLLLTFIMVSFPFHPISSSCIDLAGSLLLLYYR